jgi:hypothetical protein
VAYQLEKVMSAQESKNSEQFCKWEVCIGFNHRRGDWDWCIEIPQQPGELGKSLNMGAAPTRDAAIDVAATIMKGTIPMPNDLSKSASSMGELLFELHGPDGHVWALYANGRTAGFPDGTLVVNHAIPLLNSLRGEQKPPSPLVANEYAKSFIILWFCAWRSLK